MNRSRRIPLRTQTQERLKVLRAHNQALSNALAGRFFDVFVSLRESSRLKIRAPTQCFVRVGGSHESGRTSGDEARKSTLFGLQNRRRGRPGDPKSSASALGRAKKRSMSARSIAIFFTLGANEASQSEKVRVGGAVGALMPEFPGAPSRILDRDMFEQFTTLRNNRKKIKSGAAAQQPRQR